MIDKGKFGHER